MERAYQEVFSFYEWMAILLGSEIDCYFIKPQKNVGGAIIENLEHEELGWIGEGPATLVDAVGLFEHSGSLVLNVKERTWSVRTYDLFDGDKKLLGTAKNSFVLSSRRKTKLTDTKHELFLEGEEPDIRLGNKEGKKIAHFTRGKELWILKILDLDFDRKLLFGLVISMNFSKLKIPRPFAGYGI